MVGQPFVFVVFFRISGCRRQRFFLGTDDPGLVEIIIEDFNLL